MDHVLIGFIKNDLLDENSILHNYNKNEINSIKFDSIANIQKQMIDEKYNFTPWFYNIVLEKGNYFIEVFEKFFNEKNNFCIDENKKITFEKEVKLRNAQYTNL